MKCCIKWNGNSTVMNGLLTFITTGVYSVPTDVYFASL